MSLNGFFKRLLGLFSSKPSCRELVRSEGYRANYNKWVKTGSYLDLTGSFYKAYHYKRAGIQCSYRVQLIQEQNREGIIFFFTPGTAPADFSFFFDYTKDQVLLLGYQLRSADLLKVNHERYTQHTETYYLTPFPSDVPGSKICNQLYGNIRIDYTRVNRHPGYIRIIADSYSDVHFSAPLPFSELLKNIFEPTEV
ncbi:hypothetical protein H8S95_03995 [Pontibacter sp. KCTC 32443]|uniref:hypothetical protein n=1 Tax=Pontibacter TaxID=323449 RepID=UPI00164E650E|nr:MULTISPECIES: hypothetical protein [Pontibacter]MBC5773215.1 hypothetical protein [Pontibacter sp. KCTC 32443]